MIHFFFTSRILLYLELVYWPTHMKKLYVTCEERKSGSHMRLGASAFSPNRVRSNSRIGCKSSKKLDQTRCACAGCSGSSKLYLNNTALFTFSPVPTHSFTPVIIKIVLREKMCPYADRKDADPPAKPDGPGLSYASMYFFTVYNGSVRLMCLAFGFTFRVCLERRLSYDVALVWYTLTVKALSTWNVKSYFLWIKKKKKN